MINIQEIMRIIRYFKRYIFLLILLFYWHISSSVIVRGFEKPLVQVKDRAISANEFLYYYYNICSKNDTCQFDGILSDFIDMHLKISFAKDQNLHRKPEIFTEMTNFRSALAAEYLTDTEKAKELAIEAYNRLSEEVNISHILIKIENSYNPSDILKAYNKALRIQEIANSEIEFESLALSFSEDINVSNNRGNLGWITAFQSDYKFENVAYNLTHNEISPPVKTNYGFHILKCNGRRTNQEQNQVLPSYDQAIQEIIENFGYANDGRSEIVRKSFVEKLKEFWHFAENRIILRNLISFIDINDLLKSQNIPITINLDDILFTIDGKSIQIKDFIDFILDQDTHGDICNPYSFLMGLYEQFVSVRIINYENYKLEEKYPDFRYALAEQWDARLLLEVTRLYIWEKSASDTEGIKAFYKKNLNKYVKVINNEIPTEQVSIPNQIYPDVLNDFQFFLMNNWLSDLRETYPVVKYEIQISNLKQFLNSFDSSNESLKIN
jgi:hypothetical protein